jgi:heme oxygenase
MERPIDRLRAATHELHTRLEALPYARAVMDGTVQLAQYQSFLRAMHLIQLELESGVERAGRADVRKVYGEPAERRLLLERDLAALSVDTSAVDAAALHALVFNQRMRLAHTKEPDQLFGYLYVLEGAQLGGLVQHAALSARAELAPGLTFLRGAGKVARATFEAFCARLDAALASEAALGAAERGAIAAFEGFFALFSALAPSAGQAPSLVTELNFEAGNHALPDDLREVEAALRAGEESYRATRYYSARYGERGLRFTRSDSAWLATLVREDGTLAERHIDWLGRVLAARGMPRILLEQHLDKLSQTLARSLPERASSYGVLAACAARLRQERIDAMPEARADLLTSGFVRSRDPEHDIDPSEAATLLVAAVADERCHVPGAVAAIEGFLLDPARFSAEWVAAGRRLLTAARSHV